MGIKRIVDTSFWTDGKVDEFSPEDKYFMIYLLTNPFTTQLGIYEISIKQAAFQLGYSVDAVNALIERFENKYKVIAYSKATKEIAIKNFLKHSIIKGGAPVRDCLIKELRAVKNKELIAQVFSHIKGSEALNETVKNIIAEYEEKNGVLNYCNEKEKEKDNENENDNDNDNEVSYHDTATNRSKPSKAEIDSFFDSIWKLYPEKKGKGSVKESKRKELLKIGFEEMSRAIERYQKELAKDEWRKPQYGSTFFNSGYIDYLDANYVPGAEKPGKKEPVPSWMSKNQQNYDFDELENDLLSNGAKTVGNDTDLAARAEVLRQKLQ